VPKPIVKARIHPAIGIARVGNSREDARDAGWFIGPELPYPVPRPLGFYKDDAGRLKRQAALFRIYGYDEHDNVVAELTSANAEIAWSAHVANKKAAWYDFDIAFDIPEGASETSIRRNATVSGKDRDKLIIDGGEQRIAGVPDAPPQRFEGTFWDKRVYLGELRTDEAGRLIFLGGHGTSEPIRKGEHPQTFANNDGWYDDVSDGPVHATVRFEGTEFEADGAWVVTAPPNYAPDIVSPQTMYDVICDAVSGDWTRAAAYTTPSFRDDIMPLLLQLSDAQWVNAGFLTRYGWRGPYDFTRSDLLRKLSCKPKATRVQHDSDDTYDVDDTYAELRREIFSAFRSPAWTERRPLAWPPLYGDAYGNVYTSPRADFSVTKTRYALLAKWADGDFIDDFGRTEPHCARLDDVPLPEQPHTLDVAALHWCMGGPFHPGCEMTWPMRHGSMYREALRLRERAPDDGEADYGDTLTAAKALDPYGPLSRSGPGDVTRWMAIPWQTDTASCRSGYDPPDNFIPSFWPSRVPNDVFTEGQYRTVTDPRKDPDVRETAFRSRVRWLRGFDYDGPYLPQISRMITEFGKLGVIERRDNPNANDATDPFPPVMYVESRPTVPVDERVLEDAHEDRATQRVNPGFRAVRFGHRGRR
jgi:hypothetical protein